MDLEYSETSRNSIWEKQTEEINLIAHSVMQDKTEKEQNSSCVIFLPDTILGKRLIYCTGQHCTDKVNQLHSAAVRSNCHKLFYKTFFKD